MAQPKAPKMLEQATIAGVESKQEKAEQGGQSHVEDPTLAALCGQSSVAAVPITGGKDNVPEKAAPMASSPPQISEVTATKTSSASPMAAENVTEPLGSGSTGSAETCTPVKACIEKKTSRKTDLGGSTEDIETPPAKKFRPAGCGGSTKKATSCVVCSRPRTFDQRGAGCPICLKKMREQGVRSLQVVLSDQSLKQNIRDLSLEAKPLEDQEEPLKSQISKMESLLKNLKRLAR